jgi:hypothetical protein
MSKTTISGKSSYETTDIDLAAFLVSEGHSQLVCVRREGHKNYFVLSSVPASEIISQFVNNRITVKPMSLLETRRRLVTAMHIGTDNNH